MSEALLPYGFAARETVLSFLSLSFSFSRRIDEVFAGPIDLGETSLRQQLFCKGKTVKKLGSDVLLLSSSCDECMCVCILCVEKVAGRRR